MAKRGDGGVMSGIKSMSSHAKKRIDDIMSDGEAHASHFLMNCIKGRHTVLTDIYRQKVN